MKQNQKKTFQISRIGIVDDGIHRNRWGYENNDTSQTFACLNGTLQESTRGNLNTYIPLFLSQIVDKKNENWQLACK
jgi:hypothetical protein